MKLINYFTTSWGKQRPRTVREFDKPCLCSFYALLVNFLLWEYFACQWWTRGHLSPMAGARWSGSGICMQPSQDCTYWSVRMDKSTVPQIKLFTVSLNICTICSSSRLQILRFFTREHLNCRPAGDPTCWPRTCCDQRSGNHTLPLHGERWQIVLNCKFFSKSYKSSPSVHLSVC